MRYFFLLLVPVLAFGEWSEVRSGPFEVLSEPGDKEARLTLNYLEQLRNAIGIAVGQPDLPSVWPIRVVILKPRKPTQPALKFARDAWVCSLVDMNPVTAASVVDVLLGSWPGHVPPNIRRGLVTLYSTLDVDRTSVTLGRPPATKDRDWSRAHMLAVQPEYSGRLRVLLSNLGKGIDAEVAYKNAFEKSEADIERELNTYVETGKYGTIPVSGKPLNAQKQFHPKEIDTKTADLAMADILFANGANPGYDKLGNVEGQGLVALRNGEIDKAKTLLSQASGAFALFQYAKLLPTEQQKAVIEQSAAANPKWADPYKLLAAIEVHPAQKLAALRKASALDAHDPEIWTAMARAQESAKLMTEASKSWAAAERTTDDPNRRDQIRQLREAGTRARAEAEMAAREEARLKTERELQDLKNRALMDIRKAEARANAGKPVVDEKNLEIYKETPDTVRVTGVLTRVECRDSQATLHVQTGRSVAKLKVFDAAAVEITGGQKSFACGVQKPARKVHVDHEPGEAKKVVRIEFR